MANVLEQLRDSNAAAMISPQGERVTYTELREQIGGLAGGLLEAGIKPGDRVVLLIPMSVPLYVHLLALFHIGATATLVDPASDVQQLLTLHPPDAFIGVPKAHLLRLNTPALRGLKFYGSTGFIPLTHRRTDRLKGSCPPINAEPGPALLTFTSGTTGVPKAIARSHDFLLGQHHVLHDHMPFSEGDVDLPTLPVFLLHSLAGGATCVIADANLKQVGNIDPGPVVRQLKRDAITSSSGSPAFFRIIADHLKETPEPLPDLREVYMGGARVPASLVDDLAELLPHIDIHVVYGSTEAEPIAVLDAKKHRAQLLATSAKGALVGQPVEHIQIRIDGAPYGEIQVAGPHVNPGYVNNPEADAACKIHEDGAIWHRTGDVGHIDENGDLWLVGRVGESVAGRWPLAVEGAAESFPFVVRSGLVEIDGQPVLAVELRDPPDDWHSQIEEATGTPARAVQNIPVDPRHNAKVDRMILRERLRG